MLPLSSADALFDGPGEMRVRCRALDWATTPLGPVAGWPEALRRSGADVWAATWDELAPVFADIGSGGALEAESVPGVGSTFTLRLPRETVA